MLSAVIPTLNAANTLAATLASLAPADEVVVVDSGSSDQTSAVARAGGAHVVEAPRGRGVQLAQGAMAARGDWLLFMHADTILSAGWIDTVRQFMAMPDNRDRAAYCRFKLRSDAAAARRLEAAVAWRCRLLALPYGDQGLLIARRTYEAIGGYRALPLMEDVDLVRRLGRARLIQIGVDAWTDASRWERDGWALRSARNLLCLGLYFAGLPPVTIKRLYG